SARLAISSEAILFDLQMISVFAIELTRAPGNPLNIAIPQRTIPPPLKGDVIARHNSLLGPTDALDTEFGKYGIRMKTFPIKLDGKSVVGEVPRVENPEKFAKPAASPKPVSYLKFVSSPGDPVGQGKSYEYPGNKIVMSKTDRGVFVANAEWILNMCGPRDQF